MILSKKVVKTIFLISSIAGFVAVFFFRRNLSAEASIVNYFGYLSKNLVNEAITIEVIQEIFLTPIVGFIYFRFFDIVNVLLLSILFIPVLFFCGIKSKIHKIIGTILLLTCLLMYIISNITLPIYYNLENTEKLIEIINRIPLYAILSEISIFLLYFFGLFITISIKKISHFSKYTYFFGLLTNVIGLSYFPLGLIVGDLKFIAIVLAAPFTVIWHTLIALNLNRLRKNC